MGQIALSVVIITAAGLMLRSLWSLSEVNPGFRADRVVTAEVSMDANACPTWLQNSSSQGQPGRCQQFFSTLLERLRGLPGAENVSLTNALPLNGRQGNYVYDAEGHPRDARQGALLATGRIVSPGYFATLGVSLVKGRLLEDQDASGASRAVVIDEQMARRLWPQDDPLGRHLLDVSDEAQPTVWNPNNAVTVVGIVSNTHEGNQMCIRDSLRSGDRGGCGVRTAGGGNGGVSVAGAEGSERGADGSVEEQRVGCLLYTSRCV